MHIMVGAALVVALAPGEMLRYTFDGVMLERNGDDTNAQHAVSYPYA